MVQIEVFTGSPAGDWTALWTIAGAMVGAAATGVVTYFLQRQLSQDAARHLQRSRALACMARLRAMRGRLRAIERDIEDCRKRGDAGGLTSSWGWLQPMVSGTALSFAPEDYLVVLDLPQANLVGRLQVLLSDYEVSLQTLDLYAVKRPALTNAIPVDIVDGKATLDMDPETRRRFTPQMADLDSLADLLIQSIPEARAEAEALIGDLARGFSAHFKDPRFKDFLVAEEPAGG